MRANKIVEYLLFIIALLLTSFIITYLVGSFIKWEWIKFGMLSDFGRIDFLLGWAFLSGVLFVIFTVVSNNLEQ